LVSPIGEQGAEKNIWAQEWRLQNGELHNLFSSPNVIRVINSRSIIWVGHVARMGEMRKAYKIMVGNPE